MLKILLSRLCIKSRDSQVNTQYSIMQTQKGKYPWLGFKGEWWLEINLIFVSFFKILNVY